MAKNKKTPRISKTMEKLYGPAYARQVSQRLEDLDPELNSIIQKIPYDIFWARAGLSLRDKSLVTIAALIALGKEEQTQIHMRGFLKAGGRAKEIKNVLLHLAIYCGFPATMNGFAALNEVTRKGSSRP